MRKKTVPRGTPRRMPVQKARALRNSPPHTGAKGPCPAELLIYKEGEAYKVTVFRRSGLRRKLKPETYLLQEENGNLFMNTGFRIDVSYNEATDVLTFSPNGDYVRVKPQPGHPTEE